jgi:hypothetical protein
MKIVFPRSLKCPDCNIDMNYSHSYQEEIIPPSGSSSRGTASVYGEVDEFGYGSRTIYVYICPKCKYESNSETKYTDD